MLSRVNIPFSFTVLLESSSLGVKELMLEALANNIAAAKSPSCRPIHPRGVPLDTLVLDSFVEHVPDLSLDKATSDGILVELQNLIPMDTHELKTGAQHTNRSKVITQWLSPSPEYYNYGKVVNKPKPVADHPCISKLMAIVNQHPSSTGDMDACLISFFPSDTAALSLHKDDEELISQQSSICTVSFGATRDLEFVKDGKKTKKRMPDYSADITLPAVDGSMNVMKPGAQSVMKHRVKKGLPGSGSRFSISFRKISLPSIPSPIQQQPPTDNLVPPASPKISVPTKKNVVLLAGDSFAERLDAKLLGKGKHDVRNIAKGGSKLHQIEAALETFSNKNSSSLNVKKLFLSFGANDIRFCSNGVKHLKNATCDLMKCAKRLFPDAKIYVLSILPFHCRAKEFATGRENIVDMNTLIFQLCSRFKVFYLNTFDAFLDINFSRNDKLFPCWDPIKKWDIHPNRKGKGVLARFLIYYIHSKWFNPLGY
jgi:alkylated DNA repair dioxygenase AlkB/lysophospholipase L1-like esterase